MLRSLRQKKRYTQVEIAKMLGITQASVSRLETCKEYKINKELFFKLVEVYDICPFVLGIWLVNKKMGSKIDKKIMFTKVIPNVQRRCKNCVYSVECTVYFKKGD